MRFTRSHAAYAALGLSYAAFVLAGFLLWHSPDDNMYDLQVYRMGGHAALTGAGVYTSTSGPWFLVFTYPPLAAALFTGPSLLPFHAAEVLTAGTDLLVLPIVVYLTLGLLGRAPGRARLTATAAWTSVLLWIEPMISTVTAGQVDLVLLAVVLADLSRPDERRTKGIGIGIAAAIKLTPAVFVVYLLLTGRRRIAATAAATFAALTAMCFALLPRDSVAYWTDALWQTSRVGHVGGSGNQSIAGVVARLTGRLTDPLPMTYSFAAIAAVLCLGLAVRAHTLGFEPVGILVTAATGLLVSPISWTHHWIWFCPTLIALDHYLKRYGRAAVRLIPAGVFLACAAWPSDFLHTLPWRWAVTRAPDWGLTTFGEVARMEHHVTWFTESFEDLYVVVAFVLLLGTAVWLRRAPRAVQLPEQLATTEPAALAAAEQ